MAHRGGKSVIQRRSMAMQHRPEYQLSSQSPVLTAKFHPFDTHVIIGGTYSGQVWWYQTDRHQYNAAPPALNDFVLNPVVGGRVNFRLVGGAWCLHTALVWCLLALF